MAPSSGVHLVLPEHFSASSAGLIVPRTEDGRVLFILPWMGKTLVGTTDSSTSVSSHPVPQKEEVKAVLEGIQKVLSLEVIYPFLPSLFPSLAFILEASHCTMPDMAGAT